MNMRTYNFENSNFETNSFEETSGFSHRFNSVIMPFIYNIGASVVILGAMFKLLNLPGGSIMLGAGLSTEALIFFLSAFVKEQSAPSPQTSSQAGEHVVATPYLSKKFDECLQQAKIDDDLLNNLATSMRNFSENIAQLPSLNKLGEVTKNYVDSAEKVTRVMDELNKMNSADLVNFSAILNNMVDILKSTQSQAQNFKEELIALNEKMTALNAIYSKTLTAFRD